MARVVTFHYTLTDPAGKILDSSAGQAPLAFIEGIGMLIPGLERQMTSLKKGDKQKISVPAAEAYGAKKDGSHPLAGVDLTFDIEMVDTREATKEEISHGHTHGEHGHSH